MVDRISFPWNIQREKGTCEDCVSGVVFASCLSGCQGSPLSREMAVFGRMTGKKQNLLLQRRAKN